ncbi:MAG: helix-turn-helix domain-containing protein [Shewanella sp.]
MNIGRSIKVALAKRDMKPAQLASLMGCSTAYVSKICKSKESGIGTIKKLSDFFGMRVSEFIALGEDEK